MDAPQVRHGRSPRRRILRIVGGALTALLVISGVSGFFVYRQLNGNIRSAALYAGVTAPQVQPTTPPDPFGRRPLNILVLGSDSRALAANCDLGGACDGDIHADVELVVHVSADRTNATAMSIPRDTMTQLPACRDAVTKKSTGTRYGQINSTLEYGPGCTVAAVSQLTGIAIDHFVMADFSGVITMADAVGGASVCVSDDVFDPDSHLKLSKGRHTVRGASALQFVRTRHALGDGSDLGRTQSQHLFLSAVIRKLKSAGTLANPVKVYAVARAATKALTVDPGLASVTKLVGLAATLQKVPASRITFLTMPNMPDPADPNRVVPAPQAQRLFTAMIKDRELSAPEPASAGTPSATSPSQPSPSQSSPSEPTPSRSAPSKKTVEALDAGHARSAADAQACAQVSTSAIVYYGGQLMTPARAFALSDEVPVSAP
jgi:LCP family protein required for cell wall assembly